jgi:WD40 repeat protein
MGRDAAAIKVVSRMFDVKFDMLWQRYEREQKRKKRKIWSVTLFLSISAIAVASWIGWQNWQLQKKDKFIVEQNNSLLIGQSRYVAKEAENLMQQGNYDLAVLLAREILPMDLNKPNRPFTVEAERALRNSLNNGRIGKGFFESSVLHLHEDMIYSAQYSIDGNYILTTSQDEYMRIWDINQGIEVYSQKYNDIQEACYSPNGKHILLRFYDEIALFDINKKKVIQEIKIPQCQSVCFNQKGTLIAASSWDKILLLDEALNLIRTLIGHKMVINSMDFSFNGDLLASASGSIFNSADNSIRIWDTSSGKTTKILTGHSSGVECVRFSPDNKHIASCSSDKSIIIWEFDHEIIKSRLRGHTDFINHIEYNYDGAELISCSYDNTIRIWDVNSSKEKQILKCNGWSDFVKYNNDGNYIIAGLWEKLYMWKRTNNTNVWWYDFDSKIKNVTYSSDGKMIAANTNRGIEIWDIANQKRICKIDMEGKKAIALQFHSDNKRLIYSTSDNRMVALNVNSLEEHQIFKSKNPIYSFAISKSGVIYASIYEDDGSLSVEGWNIDEKTNLFHVKTEVKTSINHMSFNNDETILLLSCGVLSNEENYVILWDVNARKSIKRTNFHLSGVQCSAFTYDGTKIISVSEDHTLRCWDVKKGAELYKLRLSDMLNSVTLSFDGKYFATISQLGELVIGLVDSGEIIENLKIGDFAEGTVAFSPINNTLSFGIDNSLCNKAIVPLFVMLNDVRKIKRELTKEEKLKYYLSE